MRPALIVSPGVIGEDLILVAISSVSRGALSPTDHAIGTAHPEFRQTGLRVPSVLRVHKLVAVHCSVVVRLLGYIGPQLQSEVDRLLHVVLGLA